MIQITGLKASPNQSFTIADPNGGGPISFTLRFHTRTQSWYMDMTFGTFILNGFRLAYGSNVLRQYENSIPFGLAVFIADALDPFLINDPSSGRMSLFLLTTAERDQIKLDIESGALLV
jgi:hypothetical protein